jgi:hypothetical protein
MSDLTAKEQTNVLTAVRFLRARCGGWAPLVKALGFTEVTLRKPATPTVAFRVARFAKVSVDDVLTGRFPAPGTCPHCGHLKGDGDE